VSLEIEQGYLAISEDAKVRLRRAGQERLLTVKCGSGEVREETEVGLTPNQFEALWPLTASRRLCKAPAPSAARGGLCAEVDVYAGELRGLVVAEVEFRSVEQSGAFRPPPWMGREVTGDGRYANQGLALEGRPRLA
jgi:adenylate cyclase